MLDSNQRPPPCKLGQSFSGRYCPVSKFRLSKQFWTFLVLSFSCSVQVCPTPVAARLQHLTLLTAVCDCVAAVGIIEQRETACLKERTSKLCLSLILS